MDNFFVKNQEYKKPYQEMFSYLSETRCPVYPRAMNEQGMEEHCVSLLHDKVNLGNLLILMQQSMEKFVGFTLGEKKAELNHSAKIRGSADSQSTAGQ